MKKFTQFESYLITEALENAKPEIKLEIEQIEKTGKVPLYTAGYVMGLIDNLIEKVQTDFTMKNKFKQLKTK